MTAAFTLHGEEFYTIWTHKVAIQRMRGKKEGKKKCRIGTVLDLLPGLKLVTVVDLPAIQLPVYSKISRSTPSLPGTNGTFIQFKEWSGVKWVALPVQRYMTSHRFTLPRRSKLVINNSALRKCSKLLKWYHNDLCYLIEHHLKSFVMWNCIFHNFWKHMVKTVGHFDFHFSNEKVPSSKKDTFWSTR